MSDVFVVVLSAAASSMSGVSAADVSCAAVGAGAKGAAVLSGKAIAGIVAGVGSWAVLRGSALDEDSYEEISLEEAYAIIERYLSMDVIFGGVNAGDAPFPVDNTYGERLKDYFED